MSMQEKDEITTHPSFGQIEFSRQQSSGNQSFYGSELPQSNYMVMRIYESEMIRTLSSERYHNKKQLVELKMTSNQFGELITSMNYGSGVPCTLTVLPGVRVEKLPEIETSKSFTHRQFESRMKQFASTLKEKQIRVKELSTKKTLSKANQSELNQLVSWMTMEIADNIPYFAECFQEVTDKVVLEAKSEVENAILHKISTLGLQALHNENKLLTDNTFNL